MAEEELLPFDPTMKKKKKKKKTGFDPDAQDSGDMANDTNAKVEEPPADTVETMEQGQEKSVEDDFSLDFGGLKKKKRKKKTTFEMEEMKEALPAEGQVEENEPKEEEVGQTEVNPGEDLSLIKKKKKKKKTLDIDEIAKDEADTTTDNFDAVDTTKKIHKGKAWIGSDRDYSYDELLTRVFDIMREKNPEMIAGEKKKIVMRPPQVLRAGARRTCFANFSEISRMLHRQPKHLLAFIFAELGTRITILKMFDNGLTTVNKAFDCRQSKSMVN